MSDTNGPQAETTTEQRKPPTLADIVREKTDDGRRIIEFFLDVMEDRIDGAELCHRIDAAKQLEKHRSKAAARFLAKYRGVPCGHSLRRSPGSADPCSAPVATGQVSAPGPFTQDFLTVLSGIDEFLMARLIRAQTADGFTVDEFLDDVMQDRNDGFKCHHRIAAAKELIVHIVRDEQPESVPGDTSVSVSAQAPSSVRAEPVLSTVEEPVLSLTKEPVEGTEPNSIVVPAQEPAPAKAGAGTHPLNAERNSTVVPTAGSIVVPEPSAVVPAEAGTHPLDPEPAERDEGSVRAEPVLSTAEGSAHPDLVEAQPVEGGPTSVHPEPVEGPRPEFTEGPADSSSVVPAKEPAQGPQDHKVRRPRTRRTRTQRRREGAARAAMLGKHPTSERNKKDQQDKPAPVELTPAERRIRVRLEQHWHEPDPYGAPIDSTHPGRSPPW